MDRVKRGSGALSRLLDGLGEPSRRAIYAAVRAGRRPMSRADVATATGLNLRLAAFHLDRLVDAGLLVAHFARPPDRKGGPGAGRPTKWYTPATEGLEVTLPPRRNDVVARVLLKALLRDGEEAGTRAMCAAASELGAELADDCRGDAGLRSVLERLGYEPRSDAESGGTDLLNCPFHEIADEARLPVCSMNLALMKGVATQVASSLEPVFEPRTDACCVRFVATSPTTGSG